MKITITPTYTKKDLKVISLILNETVEDLENWSKHNNDAKQTVIDEIRNAINKI